MESFCTIIDPGFFTTIQDNGRLGYAHIGVPESGALDVQSYQLGNALLNNDVNAASLECTLIGPTIRFNHSCYIVLTGGYAESTIDNRIIVLNKPVFIKKNEVLHIGKVTKGCRVYVAISGGVKVPLVLKSRSYYYPITVYSHIKKGMHIPIGKSSFKRDLKGAKIKVKDISSANEEGKITIQPGPEYALLSKPQRDSLKTQIFTISRLWNRMAIQLEEKLENNLDSIYTSPVLPGIIQLTPSGKLIVLMRDCQTTGGYPRIAKVSKEGLLKLSQMQQGNRFRLTVV